MSTPGRKVYRDPTTSESRSQESKAFFAKWFEGRCEQRAKRRAKIAIFICAVLLVMRIVSLAMQVMDGDAPMRHGVYGVILAQIVLQIVLLVYMVYIFKKTEKPASGFGLKIVQTIKTVSVGLGIANAIMQLMIAHQGLNDLRATEEVARVAQAADKSQSTVVTTKMLREWADGDSEDEDDAKPAVVTTDMLQRWAENGAKAADAPQAQRVGSTWHLIGTTAPSSGREVTNAALSSALEQKTEFTAAELENFGLLDVEAGDYIRSGSLYFQVIAQPTVVTMEMLRGWVVKLKFGSKVLALVLNIACLFAALYSLHETVSGKRGGGVCERGDGDGKNVITSILEALSDLRFT